VTRVLRDWPILSVNHRERIPFRVPVPRESPNGSIGIRRLVQAH